MTDNDVCTASVAEKEDRTRSRNPRIPNVAPEAKSPFRVGTRIWAPYGNVFFSSSASSANGRSFVPRIRDVAANTRNKMGMADKSRLKATEAL